MVMAASSRGRYRAFLPGLHGLAHGRRRYRMEVTRVTAGGDLASGRSRRRRLPSPSQHRPPHLHAAEDAILPPRGASRGQAGHPRCRSSITFRGRVRWRVPDPSARPESIELVQYRRARGLSFRAGLARSPGLCAHRRRGRDQRAVLRYAIDRSRTRCLDGARPFLEFRRSARPRDLFVRPLLHLHQKKKKTWRLPVRSLRHPYPLAPPAGNDSMPSAPPLPYRSRRPHSGMRRSPGLDWTSRFNLFRFLLPPQPERGTRLSVAPFYLDLDDFSATST